MRVDRGGRGVEKGKRSALDKDKKDGTRLTGER